MRGLGGIYADDYVKWPARQEAWNDWYQARQVSLNARSKWPNLFGRKPLWVGVIGMGLTVGGVAVAANAGGEEEAPVEAAAPVTEAIAEIDEPLVPEQGRNVEGEFPGRIEAPTTTTTTAPPTTTTTAP